MRASPVVVSLAVISTLAPACAPQRENVWSRRDLSSSKPRVEALAAPAAPLDGAYESRNGWLGPRDVRGRAAVAGRQPLPSGRIRTIRQRSGSRLVFPLELGSTPLLSVVPMADAEAPCPASVRVAARRPSAPESELFSGSIEASQFAPATEEIDLGRWADGAVELLFEVSAAPDCAVEWGSPSVLSRSRRPVATPGARPNILLIGADTLRADALGTWGRQPSPTPALDRLATESDVFLDAYTTFNATNPSFASILTGLYGKGHGVYDLLTPLGEATPTLQGELGSAGYETLAILSAGHLAPRLGRGFDRMSSAAAQIAAERSVDTAIDWLSERRDRPFFLWLHLFDPHTPHTPPQPYADGRRPAELPTLLPVRHWLDFRPPGPRPYAEGWLGGEADLYAGEVAYLDRQLGRLFDLLASRDLLESTVVVFVSDHGENLEDHGVRYRHAGLWETTVHVPLMIRWPGRSPAGRRIRGLVQSLDLFPTLLGAAGCAIPSQAGIDLEAVAEGRRATRRLVFAEHAAGDGAMLRTATHKYIQIAGNPFVPDGPYLYDLTRDPAENDNLAGQDLPIEQELAGRLRRWREEGVGERRAAEQPGEEESRQLEALGYL